MLCFYHPKNTMAMHNFATHQADSGIEILEEPHISIPKQAFQTAFPEPQHSTSNPDWLRSFKGCEHYSETEALAITESLYILAKILLEST